MNPLKASARFAAFVWYLNWGPKKPSLPNEAGRFARENWMTFLACADEGMGKLLLGMSKPQATSGRKVHPQERASKCRNRQRAAANNR